jgi:hypothetical protein
MQTRPLPKRHDPPDLWTLPDAGQQIIEIVGQATGELTHRFHFLRLKQLFTRLLQLNLGLAPFGEIARILANPTSLPSS